jgi:hypothetical protein
MFFDQGFDLWGIRIIKYTGKIGDPSEEDLDILGQRLWRLMLPVLALGILGREVWGIPSGAEDTKRRNVRAAWDKNEGNWERGVEG